jgi:cytochrome o ubiquinol oxidase subunit IV
MIDSHHGWNTSFKPPFLGFILSLILIVASYRMIDDYHLSSWVLTLTLFGMAIGQALIQLVFFLHIGLESQPHWNTITFLFTVLVIVLVVGGSLWIMNNLNYNLMPFCR